MIETKLILIEGLPGSGKSTTAHKLATLVTDAGLPCRHFLEWDPDNPISIGDEAHLADVIASSIIREGEVLQQWQALAQAGSVVETVTIMESRFWQTTLMLMYAGGRSVEALLESNRQVMEAIQALQPALIYFVVDDPKAFFRRTIEIKNEEWQRAGQPTAWVDHIFSAF
jgi:thymidylate kinase